MDGTEIAEDEFLDPVTFGAQLLAADANPILAAEIEMLRQLVAAQSGHAVPAATSERMTSPAPDQLASTADQAVAEALPDVPFALTPAASAGVRSDRPDDLAPSRSAARAAQPTAPEKSGGTHSGFSPHCGEQVTLSIPPETGPAQRVMIRSSAPVAPSVAPSASGAPMTDPDDLGKTGEVATPSFTSLAPSYVVEASPPAPLTSAVSPGVQAEEAQPRRSIGRSVAPLERLQRRDGFGPADMTPSETSAPQAGRANDPLIQSAPARDAASQPIPIEGDVYLDGERVGRWMADILARGLGGPARGASSFDPLLGPRWPGTLQGH